MRIFSKCHYIQDDYEFSHIKRCANGIKNYIDLQIMANIVKLIEEYILVYIETLDNAHHQMRKKSKTHSRKKY